MIDPRPSERVSLGIVHVSISVSDLAKAVPFYVNGLGFRQSFTLRDAEMSMVQLDSGNGILLEIWAEDQTIDRMNGFTNHFALLTEDIVRSIQAAASAGATITMEPKEYQPLSIRVAFCQTPTGESIEFIESI
jgi:predicted enzyme related to lactoylglutathione lyase